MHPERHCTLLTLLPLLLATVFALALPGLDLEAPVPTVAVFTFATATPDMHPCGGPGAAGVQAQAALPAVGAAFDAKPAVPASVDTRCTGPAGAAARP